MKTVAILLCTLYLASYAVVRADDNVLSSCMEKMGLTIGDLPSLFRDNTDEGRRKRGCVEACIMQGLDLMNENVIDMQKISEQIDKVIDDDEKKESVRKAVQECVDEAVNDDECLAANTFARCGFEHVRGRFHQLVNDLRNLGQE